MLKIIWMSLLLTWFSGGGPAPLPGGEAHKFHVSYGRMVVEGNTAFCKIRFFRHDLEDALRKYHKEDAFQLDINAHADSLFTHYFNQMFVLEQEGQTFTGRIVESGEEEDMWWYALSFEAPQAMKQLRLTNKMLFDLFEDQKNVFKIIHLPEESVYSFYFTEGSEQYDVTLKS